jgi:hypothetical protein
VRCKGGGWKVRGLGDRTRPWESWGPWGEYKVQRVGNDKLATMRKQEREFASQRLQDAKECVPLSVCVRACVGM